MSERPSAWRATIGEPLDVLLRLGERYSNLYEQCHVLKAETPELKRSRLALCNITARTLQQGLNLLGINVVEKM